MDVVTVGWLTMDDIVLPSGACHRGVLGGGALYSAVGAQIWLPCVGIHSTTGASVAEDVRLSIAGRALDPEGVTAVPGNGLQLWLLHESEHAKQQVPKLTSSTAADMDRGRIPMPEAYGTARGFHVAPQTPAGSLDTARRLAGRTNAPLITLDLLSDEFIDRRAYTDLAFLDFVTAFLPSEAEVERIWNPGDLHAWLRSEAAGHNAHMAIKLGDKGSIVCDARSGALTHVPAWPANVIDTTGAGDGYCGGFLAGLVSGQPPEVCAAMGTVSASYVVEACGALMTAQPGAAERDTRLSRVLSGLSGLG